MRRNNKQQYHQHKSDSIYLLSCHKRYLHTVLVKKKQCSLYRSMGNTPLIYLRKKRYTTNVCFVAVVPRQPKCSILCITINQFFNTWAKIPKCLQIVRNFNNSLTDPTWQQLPPLTLTAVNKISSLGYQPVSNSLVHTQQLGCECELV